MTTGQRLKASNNIMFRQLTQIEQLQQELRGCRMANGILRRQMHKLRKDHAKERVKLKREIELLRNSP